MLLPLAVTTLWAIATLSRTVDDFDRMIAQSTYRLDATIQLQYRVLNVGTITAHEHMSAGVRRVSFNRDVRAVETVFRQILNDSAMHPRDRGIIERARHEWRNELMQPVTASGPSGSVQSQAAGLLGTLANAYRQDSEALRQQLDRSKQHLLWIAAAAAIGCLLIAVAGATLLTRSVLKPLHAFKQGVAHFTENDLSFRLPASQLHEFGQLAHEINRMAEHLEGHQNELQELSARDPLTGLFNRREFSQRLQAERERGRRYGPNFSLLMVDIDHFKNINDRYGHPAGDEVLTTVADLLRLSVRPMDVVCRHGGEEFAILLPETETGGAFSLAERIRHAVANSTILVSDKQSVQVTVSIGLASFKGDVGEGIDPLAIADQALYRAKRSGRNRVITDSDVTSGN
ncbi:MAG: diguanylate cyclase [Pseudomonadota bacterium]